MLYDTKGRFVLHSIGAEESKTKLCRVVNEVTAAKGVPTVVTHDGRTLRYPDPLIKKNDTVKLDLATGKVRRHLGPREHARAVSPNPPPPPPFPPAPALQIVEFIKFEIGNLVMITKGRNTGRVGVLTHKESHPGDFDICHVKDSTGAVFATRLDNVFVIGKGAELKDALVSVPCVR